MQPLEIGLCSWSANRRDPLAAIRAAKDMGVRAMQVGLFREFGTEQGLAEEIASALSEAGIECAATFVGFAGEDYSSLAAVAETVGLVPERMFADRLPIVQRISEITVLLGGKAMAIHAGALPDRESGGRYSEALNRVGRVADLLGERGLTLLLETGQEPAEAMVEFLNRLGRGNVAVNFDPGNMILYGSGDPVRAVSALKGRIDQVHVKDAVASDSPGQAWGMEVMPGTGEADIPRVISKLRASGYRGPLIIEHKSPEGDSGELADCVEFLRSML